MNEVNPKPLFTYRKGVMSVTGHLSSFKFPGNGNCVFEFADGSFLEVTEFPESLKSVMHATGLKTIAHALIDLNNIKNPISINSIK